DLYFFWLHLRWLSFGLLAMFVASLLPKDTARRLAILLAAAMIVGLILVPLVGSEVKGARRWLNVGVSLQPSEFLKPGFAIALAWILSWRLRDP
ncbi:FtsW/RodA/SpoVE family cell cycle protein, partial [Klebsiella pneumoniae]|uniref:FtsW/RodA/SpoVE family cell cycle protein n=1 Tax=Klebsiella pneumoniae TaxID=573 RepID=UPI003012C8E3